MFVWKFSCITFHSFIHAYIYINVTECVQGHDPLTFSFLSSFLFFDLGGNFMALII